MTMQPPTPNREDLEATWTYLEGGVEKIMRDLNSGVDMQTYMGVYTAVHNFCTSQKAVNSSPGNLHTTGGAHRGGWSTSDNRGIMGTHSNLHTAHLLGEDLYNNLIGYLRRHLTGLKTASQSHADEALLAFYIKEWDRYTTAAKYINHLFRYLNRHWVKREMDEGKKNIYDVYTVRARTS
jgi:cullin 1